MPQSPSERIDPCDVNLYLENDKKHLEKYPEVWSLYKEGPCLYAAYLQANEAKESFVESLVGEKMKAKDILVPNYSFEQSVRVFRDRIVDKVNKELESEGKGIQHFKVDSEYSRQRDDEYSKIDDDILKMDLKKAQEFAQFLDTVKENLDVREKVAKANELWAKVLANEESFLKDLREKVIRSAIASQYTDERLCASECDDCKNWKQELASLGV